VVAVVVHIRLLYVQ